MIEGYCESFGSLKGVPLWMLTGAGAGGAAGAAPAFLLGAPMADCVPRCSVLWGFCEDPDPLPNSIWSSL